jgi:hypothetical protein
MFSRSTTKMKTGPRRPGTETPVVENHRSRIGMPFYYMGNLDINALSRERQYGRLTADIYDIRKFHVEDRVNFLIDLYENNIIDYNELDFLYPLFIYIDLFNAIDRYGDIDEYTNIKNLVAEIAKAYNIMSEDYEYILEQKYYQIKRFIKERAKTPELIAEISEKNKGTSSDTIRTKYMKNLEEKKQAEQKRLEEEQKRLEEEQKLLEEEQKLLEKKKLEDKERLEKKKNIKKERKTAVFSGREPALPPSRPEPQYILEPPPAPVRRDDYLPRPSNDKDCPSAGITPIDIEDEGHYKYQSRIFHPDRNLGDHHRNPDCTKEATEKFQELQTLWGKYKETLGLRGGRKKSMKRKSKKQQKYNKTKKLKINKKNMKK